MAGSDMLWAQNMTVYVAPQPVKCGGNLDVMCLQVKEPEEQSYDHLVTSIEGFTFEEGYECKLSVYRGFHENSSVAAPTVYYKLRKVLSKKIPNDTLEIANRMTTCEDTKVFQCLMYKKKGGKEWYNLNGTIKGLKYRDGYEYEIVVSKKLNTNGGGGSTYDYSLVKTLSKKATMVISSENRAALEGQTYSMTRYYDNGIMNNTGKYNKPVSLTFNLNENTAGGSDGCNQMSARIEMNNSKISFGPIMSTEMYCTNVTIDKLIKTSLGKVNNYKISGRTLELYEGKTLLLEFQSMMEDHFQQK